ncbi:F-box domain [Trinorchestia longiramus]|nr:F-box domain [Trinorchestia longiramus]
MHNLLDLSDELLLKIFSHLDAADLCDVRSVCSRLDELCCDRTLWKEADFSSRRFSRAHLCRVLTPVLYSITSFSVRGLRNTSGIHSRTKLLTLNTVRGLAEKAPLLKEFVVRETVICAKQITVEALSVFRNLQSLAFINCEFVNKPKTMTDRSWFRRLEKWLPNLTKLQISGTTFVDDYDIMAMGKCSKLRKLILTNCPKVGIAMPYLAIAFRFGLGYLEYLDFRGTSLVNSDVLSILQSGNVQELFLGPMGVVKRQRLPLENRHNLIMADPHREEPPHQQVLVVNMGPDGPNWRQVRDEELDGLGLQWVRQRNEERQRVREEQEDDHFFIGENGNILQQQPLASIAEEASSSVSSSRKRKAVEESDDDGRLCKKMRLNVENAHVESFHRMEEDKDELSASELRISRETLSLGCVHELPENFKPDDCLSDLLIPNLVTKGYQLRTLHLAGCAITDEGLSYLMARLPSLTSINVMHCLVTQSRIEELRNVYKNCLISDAKPTLGDPRDCTIFCSP